MGGVAHLGEPNKDGARVKREDTLKKMDRVCKQVLRDHARDPWRWLRESDLVAALVARIEDAFGQTVGSTCAVELDKARGRCVGPGPNHLLGPRVRTELKPRGVRDGSRFDVAVMRDGYRIYLNGNGVRDASLRADLGDIMVLLEVKLMPQLYRPTRHGRTESRWLDDIAKLRRVLTCNADLLAGLLFIDTSLPLRGVGMTYEGRWPRERYEEHERASDRDVRRFWPLPRGDFFLKAHEFGGKRAGFRWDDNPGRRDVSLWALAADADPGPGGLLVGGRPLRAASVRAGRWSVRLPSRF